MICQICNQPYSDRFVLQINDDKSRVELLGHEDCLRLVKLDINELDKKSAKKLTINQKLTKLNISR